MLILRDILSSARSWLSILLHPRRVGGLVACWSFYDPSAWASPLERWESGLRLVHEAFVPALLLCLLGPCLPAPGAGRADGAAELSAGVPTSMVASFSPYASALAPLPPTTAALSSARQLAVFLLSPIAMDVLFNHAKPMLTQILSRLRAVIGGRSSPDASAVAALSRRLRSGRALRRRDYDLYLPRGDAAAKSDRVAALLFFPGFGVHHGAYAEVAGQLSDMGVPVLVASLEPFRLAHASLGGGLGDVARWIGAAGRDVAKHYGRKNRGGEGGDGDAAGALTVEWALGGHSMGGYNALQLAGEALRAPPPPVALADGATSRLRPRYVTWAAGTAVDAVPDLRGAAAGDDDDASPPPPRALVLLGAEDRIARFASPRDRARLAARLPARSRVTTLRGANHAGFASYDAAAGREGRAALDGARGIPRAEQHAAAARLTARFLLDD